MNFYGILILSNDINKDLNSLADKLKPEVVGNEIIIKDIHIIFKENNELIKLEDKTEGYYTGLDHLAFASGDLQSTVKLCKDSDIKIINNKISHNPGIWQSGMDYINLENTGYGIEICRRLDLPAYQTKQICDHLDHIGIPVSNIEQSINFYTALGFEVRSRVLNHRDDRQDIDCAMLVGHGLTIELYEFKNMDHKPYYNQMLNSLLFKADRQEVFIGPDEELLVSIL